MNTRPLRRTAAPLAAAAALATLATLLVPAEASAQTITLNPAGVTRAVALRAQQYSPMAISRADCEQGDQFFFPLTLGGNYAAYELQVWAGTSGTDCVSQTSRTGTTPVCWQVYRGVPATITPTIEIATQDIIGQHKPPDGAPGSGTLADCAPTSGSTTVAQTVQLTFMFVTSTGGDGIGAIPYPVTFDLAGPPPPTDVSAGIGDTLVVLNWTPTTSNTDLVGYNFYCDPVPGQESSAGTSGALATRAAGTSSDAGDEAAAAVADAGEDAEASASDAGTTASTDAGSDAGAEPGLTVVGACTTKLVAGKEPDPARLCGGVGDKMGKSGNVSKLVNGRPYAVAVAGVDTVGNVGPLSNVVCATPQPVDDFFKLYREAGGKAGGGFCSVPLGPVGSRSLGALAVALGAAGVALVTRRRGPR